MQIIQKDNGTTQAQLAVAALQNANLRDAVPDTLIAGVDLENFENLDPQMVTDNEDDANNAADDDSDVDYVGENLGQEDQEQDKVVVDDSGDDMQGGGDDDDEQGEDGDDEDSGNDDENGQGSARSLPIWSNWDELSNNDSTGATRRRSARIRKKIKPTVIDFEKKAYQTKDRVIHINPNVLDQARDDLKITSDILPSPKTVEDRGHGVIRVQFPPAAGITKQALNCISLGAMGLPEPKLTDGKIVVEDHVMMHVLGVVLVEQ